MCVYIRSISIRAGYYGSDNNGSIITVRGGGRREHRDRRGEAGVECIRNGGVWGIRNGDVRNGPIINDTI